MAKKLTKKKKVEQIEAEPIFYLKIIANNEVYETTGDNLKDLMVSFTPPVLLKNETNIIAVKNKKTVQRDLKVYDARRLFNNKTNMILFTDNLLAQLG